MTKLGSLKAIACLVAMMALAACGGPGGGYAGGSGPDAMVVADDSYDELPMVYDGDPPSGLVGFYIQVNGRWNLRPGYHGHHFSHGFIASHGGRGGVSHVGFHHVAPAPTHASFSAPTHTAPAFHPVYRPVVAPRPVFRPRTCFNGRCF